MLQTENTRIQVSCRQAAGICSALYPEAIDALQTFVLHGFVPKIVTYIVQRPITALYWSILRSANGLNT